MGRWKEIRWRVGGKRSSLLFNDTLILYIYLADEMFSWLYIYIYIYLQCMAYVEWSVSWLGSIYS